MDRDYRPVGQPFDAFVVGPGRFLYHPGIAAENLCSQMILYHSATAALNQAESAVVMRLRSSCVVSGVSDHTVD